MAPMAKPKDRSRTSIAHATTRTAGQRARRSLRPIAAVARYTAEALEGRTLLSLAAQISGPATIAEGGTVTLNLSATGSDAASVAHWTVNKGDGTAPVTVAGAARVTTNFTLAAGTASARITATATTTGGVTSN